MPLIRPTALRSLQSTLRYSGARATVRAAPARTQLVARRYASSGGHGGAHGEASSDLPWILGALIITPPSCWYLWPDSSSHAEHHDEHAEHEEHGKPDESEQSKEDGEPQEDAAPAEQQGEDEKGDEEEKPSEEEKPAEKEESKNTSDGEDQGKDEKSSEDSADKDEQDTEGKEQPEGKSEGKSNVGKGKMSDDSAGNEQTRKLEDSPKGGQKKRLDSGLGKNLGSGPTYEDGQDAPAQSKPTGSSSGDISSKQKGMSNTDTRHSVQIDEPGTEKSTKGSGGPETAKHKDTVDSSGPLK